ncbi:hypothetical protein M378DRAFT_77637 [Amanita muscaria Koide BX008]|uniref:ER-bound oxygenase mpaB/mpaB'/Rubber oxygenase catalytic domain-containing protein n=1 Tax=Amanita muscaria (strain Koide BX008) TaxID=946122 RepID=A0A0C2X7R6_AMAMK|nr:hypothetical protein M378DRAFT_77637 [Amanita muscaria Koide BX008]
MALLPLSNTAVACSVAVLSYLLLVRLLRWRRYNAIHAKYQSKLEDITPEEAQEIMHVSQQQDMPSLIYYATAFALFKTYAIPSISKILDGTKQIGSLDTISRRYADTDILISTWAACPINGIGKNNVSDPRAMLALARTNWLHAHFSISNDDMLLTLSLFVLEPLAWADKYGWRPLSPLEKQAYYVFWMEIGRRMNIRDIPDTLEGLYDLAKAYEVDKMIAAETNKAVSGATVEELIYSAPKFMKPFARKLVAAALEDHVRNAMMMPKPRWYMYAIVNLTMYSTAFVSKYLMLPRLRPWAAVELELPSISEGEPVRMHPTRITALPWYKPESKGLGYLRDRLALMLGLHSDIPGLHLKSDGYILPAQGPNQFENIGHEQVVQMAEELLGHPIPEEWKKIA